MAQLQELTKMLLSAGYAADTKKTGNYLYTDGSNLILKHWNGWAWADEDIIAVDVRANSSTPYLISPTTKRIVYIATDSTLHALRFDEEELEWVPLVGMPAVKVHPESNLAACFVPGSQRDIAIVYQDSAKQLALLFSNHWSRIRLPFEPVQGSPIAALATGNKMFVLSISITDHYLHYLSPHSENVWRDGKLVRCALDETYTRLIAEWDEEGSFNVYALTVGRALLLIKGKEKGRGEVEELGKINQDGKFVARAT